MTARHLLAMVTAIVLVGCSPSKERSQSSEETTPNPAVLSNLEQIVEVRQRIAQSNRLLIQAGRAPDDGASEIALAEARIELARERHQRDQVLAELKRIIEIQEGRLARAKATATDRISAGQLEEIRAAVLQANVEFAREQARHQR